MDYVEQVNIFPDESNPFNRVIEKIGLNGLSLAYKFNQYSEQNGLNLHAEWNICSENFWENVETMLENDLPVIMSVGPFGDELNFYPTNGGAPVPQNGHYFTVTGIIYPEAENNYNDGRGTLLRVATWGGSYDVVFDEYEKIRTDEGDWFDNLLRDLTTNILIIEEKNDGST